MLESRTPFHDYDALHAEVVLAAEALAVVYFLDPVMVLEFFVTEMSLMPSVIFVSVPISIMAMPTPMFVPRISVPLGIPVLVVITIVLRKSGYARRNTQSQNSGKAYANQSHRCLSTAK